MNGYQISKNQNVGFANLENHIDKSFIKRYSPDSFPIHLAVHRVDIDSENNSNYATEHFHDDELEINILIPDKGSNLEYLYVLGDDEMQIEGHNSIYIEPKVKHSAKAIRGKGYFVCIRFKISNE